MSFKFKYNSLWHTCMFWAQIHYIHITISSQISTYEKVASRNIKRKSLKIFFCILFWAFYVWNMILLLCVFLLLQYTLMPFTMLFQNCSAMLPAAILHFIHPSLLKTTDTILHRFFTWHKRHHHQYHRLHHSATSATLYITYCITYISHYTICILQHSVWISIEAHLCESIQKILPLSSCLCGLLFCVAILVKNVTV